MNAPIEPQPHQAKQLTVASAHRPQLGESASAPVVYEARTFGQVLIPMEGPSQSYHASSLPAPPMIDFKGLLRRLYQKKWILISLFLLGLLPGVLYWLLTAREYEAAGLVEIGGDHATIEAFEGIQQRDTRGIDVLNTAEVSLTSNALIERVLNREIRHPLNGVVTIRDYVRSGMPVPEAGVVQPSDITKVFKNRSSVSLLRGTRLLEIAYSDRNPQLALAIASAYMDEARHYEVDQTRAAIAKARKAIGTQIEDIGGELRDLETQLQKYREANKQFSLDEDEVNNGIASGMRGLNDQLVEAQGERIQLELNAVRTDEKGQPLMEDVLKLSAVTTQPEIQDLTLKIRDAEAAFDAVEQEYLFKHPLYKEAAEKLTALNTSLERQALKAYQTLVASYDSSLAKESRLQDAIAQQQNQANERQRVLAGYRTLVREITSRQSVQETLLMKSKEIDAAEKLVSSNVHLVEQPLLPQDPLKPNRLLAFVLALFGGGSLAGLWFLGSEMVSQRVTSPSEAEQCLSLPCLASVPRDRSGDLGERFEEANASQSVAAMSFRNLRNALLLSSESREPQSILFASVRRGRDAADCAMNAAMAMCRKNDITLLIDADFDGSGLEEVFLREPQRGLADYLSGQAQPEEICFATAVPNLYFIPSGSDGMTAREYLANGVFGQLLDRASQCFHRIIINGPPLVPSNEAVIAARHADASCLVLAGTRTSRRELQAAKHLFDTMGSRPIGFVYAYDSKLELS